MTKLKPYIAPQLVRAGRVEDVTKTFHRKDKGKGWGHDKGKGWGHSKGKGKGHDHDSFAAFS